jgi:phage terminase small subunit
LARFSGELSPGQAPGFLFSGAMNITPKQEAFCLAYIDTGNASEAYRRAYCAAKMKMETVNRKAFDLLQNGKITARVDELRAAVTEKAVKKLEISKEWVLEQLVETVKMAKQAEPVYDNDGNPIGEYKQNLAAGNKALELIGKELGMFVDRKEIRTGALEETDTETLMEMRRQIEARKRADVRVH